MKAERLRKEQQEQNERKAAEVEEREREREFDLRVQRAVQERERELRRQAALVSPTERRRRRGAEPLARGGEEHDEDVDGERNDDREELQRRMATVENMVQDPNSSVLRDPAAIAVVRAPGAPGSPRSSRQRLKCPIAGCPVTRNSLEALNVYIDNAHA